MIVIIKELTKDGKLVFEKEELEKLLEQARSEGYKEGKASNHYWYWSPNWSITGTSTATNTTSPYKTDITVSSAL